MRGPQVEEPVVEVKEEERIGPLRYPALPAALDESSQQMQTYAADGTVNENGQ